MRQRPWQPVILNLNYSSPLWGVQKPHGPYLRDDRDEAGLTVSIVEVREQ